MPDDFIESLKNGFAIAVLGFVFMMLFASDGVDAFISIARACGAN